MDILSSNVTFVFINQSICVDLKCIDRQTKAEMEKKYSASRLRNKNLGQSVIMNFIFFLGGGGSNEKVEQMNLCQ